MGAVEGLGRERDRAAKSWLMGPFGGDAIAEAL